MRYRALVLIAACAIAAPVLDACNGSGTEEPFFKNCGDGTIVPPENCDDGPANSDTGACLTICIKAICGDGFVWAGVEQCDLNNLDSASCDSLGFGSGRLQCFGCSFDTSQCGPPFTPTPTRTSTPVVSATPTPTPTPTRRPTATPGGVCTPAGIAQVTVNFQTPADQRINSIAVRLDYDMTDVSLPEGDVRSRIRNRPVNTLLSATNTMGALQANVSTLFPQNTFPPGRLFTVDFDTCAGAPPPVANDFVCAVEQCAVQGCSCSVTVP